MQKSKGRASSSSSIIAKMASYRYSFSVRIIVCLLATKAPARKKGINVSSCSFFLYCFPFKWCGFTATVKLLLPAPSPLLLALAAMKAWILCVTCAVSKTLRNKATVKGVEKESFWGKPFRYIALWWWQFPVFLHWVCKLMHILLLYIELLNCDSFY